MRRSTSKLSVLSQSRSRLASFSLCLSHRTTFPDASVLVAGAERQPPISLGEKDWGEVGYDERQKPFALEVFFSSEPASHHTFAFKNEGETFLFLCSFTSACVLSLSWRGPESTTIRAPAPQQPHRASLLRPRSAKRRTEETTNRREETKKPTNLLLRLHSFSKPKNSAPVSSTCCFPLRFSRSSRRDRKLLPPGGERRRGERRHLLRRRKRHPLQLRRRRRHRRTPPPVILHLRGPTRRISRFFRSRNRHCCLVLRVLCASLRKTKEWRTRWVG